MYDTVTLDEATKNAEHYRALGEERVSLEGDVNTLDWSRCTEADPGGLHRIDIAVSVWFKFRVAEGIAGSWSFDVENREANGTDGYDLRLAEIGKILAALPDTPRVQFTDYLGRLADATEKRGADTIAFATKQLGQAGLLRQLVRSAQPKTAAF